MSPSIDRPVKPDPYALQPPVPAFTLTSDDLVDGERLADAHTNTDAGDNVSPQLSWSGFPPQTASFLVSCYDPDAPGVAGWWHWTLVDVPATTTSLPRGAGDGSAIPPGSFHLRGDDGEARYVGAAPPPGDQVHRYFFVVHALDVASLGLSPSTSPNQAACVVDFHTLGRAVLVGTYQR
jgi:Raf kinase inhibitor-like YbhB/YbcL family protein